MAIMSPKLNGVTPTESKKDSSDAKENLWTEILSEVQKQGSTKLPSNKSILVLGDNASGKTSLIAKLQGVEDPKKKVSVWNTLTSMLETNTEMI